MILKPTDVKVVATGLDHPEGLCIGLNDDLYAGGEAGQLYRVNLRDGSMKQIGTSGGFALGMAVDGRGNVHVCDVGRKAVIRFSPDGRAAPRGGDNSIPSPNYPVFDRSGNLFVSDTGEYHHAQGTGRIHIVRPDDRIEVFHAGPFRFANGLAIDPSGQWLYIVQSRGPDVVRVPLNRANGTIERAFLLPERSIPDGLAFSTDGRLVISCYRPDAIFVGHPNGKLELLCEDPTGDALNQPTNVALHGGMLYIANLGGSQITAVKTDMQPAPMNMPLHSDIPKAV